MHELLKWFFTFGAGCLFVQMCKQMALPLAPRTVVTHSGRRIRKGTLDNALDGAGAVFTFLMFLGIAGALWIL